MLGGPTYETHPQAHSKPIGADVVGMSTIPDFWLCMKEYEEGVYVQKNSGRRLRRSQENEIVSHDEVFQICKQKADIVKLIVERVVGKI